MKSMIIHSVIKDEAKDVEEKLFYDSIDNIKLCGLLSKVNDSDKIVILCHGLKADKTERNSFNVFVDKLKKNNINSFRFDFRGHGESSGNDYEMTPTKEVLDLESTIKFLNDKGYSEIIILGASFGASIISMINYNKFNCVKGLISWYGALDYFATIEEDNFFSKEHKEIADRNGYYEIISKRTGKSFKLGYELYKEIYSIVPYKKLINVNLPILFVHGLCDKMIPYELSIKVSKMCKNSELELIENGDHTFDNDINALNRAIDVSINFIKDILSEEEAE